MVFFGGFFFVCLFPFLPAEAAVLTLSLLILGGSPGVEVGQSCWRCWGADPGYKTTLWAVAVQQLGWINVWVLRGQGSPLCCSGPIVAGLEVKIPGEDCCWGLWAARRGLLLPPKISFCSPWAAAVTVWPCVVAEGTVLAGCIWKPVWETAVSCTAGEMQGHPWWSECVVSRGSSAWVGLQWWPHPSPVIALISAMHERDGLWKSSRWLLVFLLLCICVRSCLEQALCLLVACETVSSRKLQKYFMKCSNKNNHVVQPMQNNTFGLEQGMQFL